MESDYKYMESTCRLCGENNSKKLYTRKFLNPNNSLALKEYDVRVCLSCGFGFASNVPQQAYFNEYYIANSIYTERSLLRGRNQNNIEAVSIIMKYAKDKNSSILDIGCAEGNILSLLVAEGFKNLTGVDPSPTCIKSIETLGGGGIVQGICSSFEQLDRRNKSDIVLLTQVLEHICDLHALMRILNEVVDHQGVLLITVPDVYSFKPDGQAPFQEFSIEHINFFSEKTLSLLASRFGFVLCEAIHSRYSLACVFKKGYDYDTEPSLANYIESSKKIELNIIQKLEPFAGKQIIVWGVGTFGRYLLAEGILSHCDIVAFVDRNHNYSNDRISCSGKLIPIITPQMLQSSDTPIIITTQLYQDEIFEAIKELGLDNPVVPLF